MTANAINTPALVAAALLLGVAWPAPARAADRQVTATVAVEQEYVDNLFWSEDDKESEFITTVSPGLELSHDTERLKSRAKIQVQGLYYHENSDLNDLDQDYLGSLRYALTERANLFTSARYRRDSRNDSEFTETGLVVDNVCRDRYTFGLGGDYALSELLRARLSYDFDGEYYSSDSYSDYASQSLGLQFDRDLSDWLARTTGRLNLAYGYFDLEDIEVNTWSLTAGGERSLDERVSFFADFGLTYVTSTFTTVRLVPSVIPNVYLLESYEDDNDGVGLIGKAGFSYSGELTDGRIFFSRSVAPASGRDGTVARTSLQGEVGRRLSETSRLSLSAGYVINKADQDQLATQDIDEHSLWVRPGLSYSLTDDLQLKLSYSYDRVDDKVADSIVHRNMVLVQLVYEHQLLQ